MAARTFARLLVPLVLLLAGCGRSEPGVVVYTALDRDFSEPIFKAYQAAHNVEIRPKFDIESTKTVGLTQAILAEADRPRCDLFWNNEILNTLRLKQKGLLQTFAPPNAADLPEAFRDPDGMWYGFAARARILLVNTDLVPEARRPSSILDLADPAWKGKIGLAKPLFGTTATHAACLFSIWGDDKAKAFFRSLKANDAQVLSGNKQVALAVGAGSLAIGWTDTDDAMEEIAAGHPVVIIYPDRNPDQMGTLFIPNTIAMVKGAPHAEAAKALANHLLGPEVEGALAKGPSAQIPLNRRTETPARVETPKTVKPLPIDFNKAVQSWDNAARFLADEFAGG